MNGGQNKLEDLDKFINFDKRRRGGGGGGGGGGSRGHNKWGRGQCQCIQITLS